MTTSCGVIILNNKNQILGCYPCGRKDGRHDIPKGKLENNEEFLQCALRETYEEIGIILKPTNMKVLGMFPYLSDKNLFLYKTYLDVDSTLLKCNSYFEYNGKKFPEMVSFKWIEKENIEKEFFKSLFPIILKVI